MRQSVLQEKSAWFQALYREHAAFVLRSLRRLGVRSSDVEDAAQEVFSIVHRKFSTWEGRGSLKSWIFGIALRVAADFRKRAHIRRETPNDQLHDLPVEIPTALDLIARTQARAQLDRLLGELDEAKRATFVLFELEGLPMVDVADLTGVPPQTAYARLYAARKHISRWVANNVRSTPTG